VVAAYEGRGESIPAEGYLIGVTLQVGRPSANMFVRRYIRPGLTIHQAEYDESSEWNSALVGGDGPVITMWATGPGPHVPGLAEEAQKAGSAYSTFLELEDAFVTADAVQESGRRLGALKSDALGPHPEGSVWVQKFVEHPDRQYFYLNRTVAHPDDAVAVLRAIGQGMGFTGDKLERYTEDMKSHIWALRYTPDTQSVKRMSPVVRMLSMYAARLIDFRG
jgi:hypothetical protein